MNNLIDHFRLKNEKEEFQLIISNIEAGVVLRGTNLWILIFAIFVASLGLNVNSTAVIIGAMLISPLMGPIMGMGLGIGIHDIPLLRKSLYNYLFAAGVGLVTSTLYFLISPLNEAHSEILARTSPNIYDVLIAVFGGLAGILAMSSKQKGNVIPGVAIATALMPPLCTAGYGLATFKFAYFFGAFYLFIINSVFIALAAFITSRLLKFPFQRLPNHNDESKARRTVAMVVIITLLPSLYFGYDIVQVQKYSRNAARFIETEAVFPNDYLLKRTIDAKKQSILLTYGGEKISPEQIELLKQKLQNYGLQNSILEVRQGFAYLGDSPENEQVNQLSKALAEKDNEISKLKAGLDSSKSNESDLIQLRREIKALYPNLSAVSVSPIVILDSLNQKMKIQLVYAKYSRRPDKKEELQLESWLAVKFRNRIKLIVDK